MVEMAAAWLVKCEYVRGVCRREAIYSTLSRGSGREDNLFLERESFTGDSFAVKDW